MGVYPDRRTTFTLDKVDGFRFRNIDGSSPYPARDAYHDVGAKRKSSSSAAVWPSRPPSPDFSFSALTNLSDGAGEPQVQSPQFDSWTLTKIVRDELIPLRPSLSKYFQSVRKSISVASYTKFLFGVVSWWRKSSETLQLVQEVSELLFPQLSLLKRLEDLIQLRESSRIFVCLSDTQEMAFTILATARGSHIFPASSEAKAATCDIKNTEDLHALSISPDAQEKLSQIHPIWVPPVMQLLQFELDSADVESQYRKACLRHLRKLARIFHVLPPSLFVRKLAREGNSAVRGGGFADIWRGRYGDQPVCLKVLRMFLESDERTRKKLISDFCHEALIWKQLHHPNVLPFLGVNTDIFAPGFCLISPWMSNGDIMVYLKNHPEHDRLAAITEIASGMDYLHSLYPPIVHGDIRGANILVTDAGTCCLADFGLALAAETQALATSTGNLRGSVRWLAPELIGFGDIPTASGSDKCPRDVYAFACTMLEIISGQVPFAHRAMDPAVIFDVVSGIRPPRPQGVWCPDEIWALVEDCWVQDPTKRPTSKTICANLAVQDGDQVAILRTSSPEPLDSESDDQDRKQFVVLDSASLPSETIDYDSIEHVMFVGKVPKDAMHEIPPSLFVRPLVKEGIFPVCGGGLSDIWKGRYGDQPVCLKVLRVFSENDEQARKKLESDFCHEALIWKQLHHPNVLPFLGVNTDTFSPGFCLVSPWMENGDIMSFLKKYPYHSKLAAITEIASGMNYLHSLDPPIVHGNICGANILVTDKGTCCLADFRLALVAESQVTFTTRGVLRGSLRWLAPELIGPSALPTTSGSNKPPRDVYAFGCTVLEIISGLIPFAHRSDAAVIFDVYNGARPPRPEGVWCPDEIWALVEECWAQDSSRRPDSKAICASLAAQNSQSTSRITSDTGRTIDFRISNSIWRRDTRSLVNLASLLLPPINVIGPLVLLGILFLASLFLYFW